MDLNYVTLRSYLQLLTLIEFSISSIPIPSHFSSTVFYLKNLNGVYTPFSLTAIWNTDITLSKG
jgi:hypothetical protein